PSRNTTAFSHCFATFGERENKRPSRMPAIAPSGLAKSNVTPTPAATNASSTTTETTFTRGTLAGRLRRRIVKPVSLVIRLSLSFTDTPAQVFHDLRRRKAEHVGLGQKAFAEHAQALLLRGRAPTARKR